MRIEETRINVNDKKMCLEIFKKLMKKIKSGDFDYKDTQTENYLIINEDRLNSHFIHVVPKKLESFFNEIKGKNQNSFLGFTVLVGRNLDKDVRLSCFGIPCSELTRVLIQ